MELVIDFFYRLSLPCLYLKVLPQTKLHNTDNSGIKGGTFAANGSVECPMPQKKAINITWNPRRFCAA
jgi:hypothetical protein